jgi:hypothetical protein
LKFRLFILTLAALALALPEALVAQVNLSVRPMRVEADVPPNRVARVNLRVHNRHEVLEEVLNLEVVDLTQSPDGTLRILTEEERSQLDAGALSASSRDWVQLPAERIVLEAGTSAEIPVLLSVPADARGAYVSAIRITTDEPPMPEGTGAEREAFFAIRFAFLVPFVTEIAGRPVQQDIAIEGVDMVFQDGRDEDGESVADPNTRVAMEIANDGRTYSSLEGEVVVEQRVGENWRTVSRASLPDRRILPGLTLRLTADLDRRLPSGEYRLLGNLRVDGRLLPRFERIIDFEGDPEADAVAFDTTLTLEPLEIEIDALPGAARNEMLSVTNPSDQPIDVAIALQTPASLEGVAMGERMGEEFSAAEWSEAMPSEFTLRPGQSRNVRVMSRMPREGMDLPTYYADIVLAGTYEDGQSAGETTSRLRIRQQEVEIAPGGVFDRMGVSVGEGPSSYIVQGRFANTGNVDIALRPDVQLINTTGEVVRSWPMGDGEVRMLPLELRDFGGEIDIGDVAPGEYTLRLLAEAMGARLADRQMEVAIADSDDGEARTLDLVND